MTIETTYKIGDNHWNIDGNRANASRVKEIRISVQDCGDAPPLVAITYVIDGMRLVPEDQFVTTKQDLLDSL